MWWTGILPLHLPATAVSISPSRLGSTSHPLQTTAGGICCFNHAEQAIRQMDISWLIFNSSDARELRSFMAGRSANGPGLGIMGGYLWAISWECRVGLSIEHHYESWRKAESHSKTHCPAIDLSEARWRSSLRRYWVDAENSSLSRGGSKNMVVNNVCTPSNTARAIDFFFSPNTAQAHRERSNCRICKFKD